MGLSQDALYFLKHYAGSIQAKVQNFRTEDPEEIFKKGLYCLLTPATKADSARACLQRLLKDGFIFKAPREALALCLRKKPYIRFHNQKAERLEQWRDQGQRHIAAILALSDEKEMRSYLVRHVLGMNYKEASHFLRNIGRGTGLAILDRHILAFMEEEGMIPSKNTPSPSKPAVTSERPRAGGGVGLTPARYKAWEEIFCGWAQKMGVPLPQADYAIWAAGVRRRAPSLSYEYILKELE